jgi:hypothetical protein
MRPTPSLKQYPLRSTSGTRRTAYVCAKIGCPCLVRLISPSPLFLASAFEFCPPPRPYSRACMQARCRPGGACSGTRMCCTGLHACGMQS